MLENIIKYISKNREKLLVFLGEVAIVAFAVYFIGSFFTYLKDEGVLRIDPILSVAVVFLGFKFVRSLSKQNQIIEQQAQILKKVSTQGQNGKSK